MVKEEYEVFEALRHEFEYFPPLDSTFQVYLHSSFLTMSLLSAKAYIHPLGVLQI